MKRAFILFVFIFLFIGICLEPVRADEADLTAQTESGKARGYMSDDGLTMVWKGIPFAAPPVGDLRFRAPVPAPEWGGVLDALEYGSVCMQVPAKNGMSEDCLYLNVFKPAKSGVFPVMVWIHGGGYVMGSGGSGNVGLGYDGSNLAAAGDVVVVSFNYRLGPFGFLADPGLREEDENSSAGNYGSLDQVRAIEWVHDNIRSFGGDPDNVTIFGESAGGWSVCTMLATPLNRGRIHGAILESGGCGKSESLEKGYERARAIYKRIGCKEGDLECLRAAPASKFMKGGLITFYNEGMLYAPHHDGYLLDDAPLQAIRDGKHNKVPFIAGYNRDEFDKALYFRKKLWYTPPWDYARRAGINLGLTEAEKEELAALYPLEDYDGKPRYAYGKMVTDSSLACPTYLGLEAAARYQDKVFLYRFDYDDYRFGRRIGAFHGFEVPLVFGNLPTEGKMRLYDESNIEGARELSRVIQAYWTNFAKSHDPNGEGLPEWPKFDRDNPQRITLDTTIAAEPAGMEEKCSFWDGYNDSGRAGVEMTLGRNQARYKH